MLNERMQYLRDTYNDAWMTQYTTYFYSHPTYCFFCKQPYDAMIMDLNIDPTCDCPQIYQAIEELTEMVHESR